MAAQPDILRVLLKDGVPNRHLLSKLLGQVHRPKKLPRFSETKQMEATIQSLRVCNTVLEQIASHPPTDPAQAMEWAKALREIRTSPSQTIKSFEGGENHG